MRFSSFVNLAAAITAAATPALGCDSCYGRSDINTHVRNVRRMQPDAQNATSAPRGPLAWGQLNFLHTTDTHGWLEGHIKEKNYGADWGDFISFTAEMRLKALALGVDLLLIDTGDLHDGNGLSDAEMPDGVLSNKIFEQLSYDLLTIGNHELYLSDIAYDTASQLAKRYGDRYVASNVQIFNNASGQYEYFAPQYRYFTTLHGLRIMAFGVLYDFTGNSNASKVIPAKTMIQEPWFQQAINYSKPIDLFLLLGHNPLRSGSGSTLTTIHNAIRAAQPNVPIQAFGGHTHIRDFAVYDAGSTGIESGRYCETLGFVSMSGIKSTTFWGAEKPFGVPYPSLPAKKVVETSTSTTTATSSAVSTTTPTAFADLRYFRRYLDWNRLTFAYHAVGSQSHFIDTIAGERATRQITQLRTQLNLTALYGCAPQTWCLYCQPYLSNGSIFSLLQTALSATVINETRADVPRLIIINTGSVRFDLVEGPFTYDDSFIVSPFTDTFQFLPDVPYAQAKQVLGILNKGAFQKRSADAIAEPESEPRDLTTHDFAFTPLTGDSCVDASSTQYANALARRSRTQPLMTRGLHRRVPLAAKLTPGYTTTDDFGTDGDDTIHSPVPNYSVPNDLQANASFPTDGSEPATVDLIFLDFIGTGYVLPALKSLGLNYTAADIQQYLPTNFTTNSYLPAYARAHFSPGPDCAIGQTIGATALSS